MWPLVWPVSCLLLLARQQELWLRSSRVCVRFFFLAYELGSSTIVCHRQNVTPQGWWWWWCWRISTEPGSKSKANWWKRMWWVPTQVDAPWLKVHTMGTRRGSLAAIQEKSFLFVRNHKWSGPLKALSAAESDLCRVNTKSIRWKLCCHHTAPPPPNHHHPSERPTTLDSRRKSNFSVTTL